MFKPANIKQPTPAKRGSRPGNDASDFAALCFHSGQHGFNGGRDRNAEGLASSTLGAGERKDAILQVHAGKRYLRLPQSAPCSQGDLEAHSHPLWHSFYSESFPGDFNLIIRKNGFNTGDRPPLNSVIQKGDRVHLSEQSALAVNPLKNLQVLAGLVPSSLTAGGAWEALAPFQINFTIGWRKGLQGYFFLTNKSRQMTPRIFVINFCQRANGVIFNQIINPVVAAIFSLFVNAKSSCVSRCLCAMQSIVDSVAGAFAAPFSSRVFKTYKEPRAAAFLVRIRHGDNGNIYLV